MFLRIALIESLTLEILSCFIEFMSKKGKYPREIFAKVFGLYRKHSWLLDKELCVKDLLLREFDKSDEIELIIDLLNDFTYLTYAQYTKYLQDLSTNIVRSGFKVDQTQIVAFTCDSEADSGQKILNDLKVNLQKMGWGKVETVNNINKAVQKCHEGKKNQIILVDEFIGSGRTVRNRVNLLNKRIVTNYELKIFVICGMDFAVTELENNNNKYTIYCALRLRRGIEERYSGEELTRMKEIMNRMESKLAQTINNENFEDYAFGFGRAEALYSMEECNGNTPNSVFPIFWWPKDVKNEKRSTLLTRFEKKLG